MKTGDILELAEVVRNLALRDHEKGLSTGEKQMYVKAKKILACGADVRQGDERGPGARVARRGACKPRQGQAGEGEVEDGGDSYRLAKGASAPRKHQAKAAVSVSVPSSSSGEAGGAWAILVAAGTASRLGGDRPKAFVGLAGRPLLAESLERLDISELHQCYRRGRASLHGGAGDPPRRGDRRLEGRGCRRRRRDTRRSPYGMRSRMSPTMRSSCLSTTPPGRSSTTR